MIIKSTIHGMRSGILRRPSVDTFSADTADLAKPLIIVAVDCMGISQSLLEDMMIRCYWQAAHIVPVLMCLSCKCSAASVSVLYVSSSYQN